MAKKKTLEQKIDALTAAVADDIAQIRKDMVTKEQLAGLQTQVNSD